MVRMHRTQRYPVGTRISKYFNGYKDPFQGTVDQHSDVTDFYHISYDDGDSEEMTEDDVETHFLSMPKRRTSPPVTLKRTNSNSSVGSTSSMNGDRSTSAVASSKGKGKVLSLNDNAPDLVRGNSFTETGSRSELRVSIPKETHDEEADDEEMSEEEEEEEDEEDEQEDEEDEEEEEEDDDESDGPEVGPEEINRLITKPVQRVITKEDGSTETVQGAVSSYFPATRMFRVMYFDGECSDLSYQEVLESIPLNARPITPIGKRKHETEEPTRSSKSSSRSAPSASPKRQKTLELNTASSTSKATARTKRNGITKKALKSPSPDSPVAQESDMASVDDVEFNILRKVLYIAVSTLDNDIVDAQLKVLSSSKVKDKEAVKMFVRKDGLVSLKELLSKWETQEDTHQGVLLILKILTVLPGITSDDIVSSKIGKKMRDIARVGVFNDESIPAIAAWAIQKMKSDLGIEKEKAGRKSPTHANGNETRKEKNNSRSEDSGKRSPPSRDIEDKSHNAKSKPDTAPRRQGDLGKAPGGPALKRSNSVNHLHNLMSSKNGRDSSTVRRDRDIFGNLVVAKRKLGTANNWRARRSTVVLDQVSKRVNDNAQEVEFLKTQQAEEEERPTKISFSDGAQVLMFEKEVEVSKLLRPAGLKAPARPPAKRRTGPLRPILKRSKYTPPPAPTQEQPASVPDDAPPAVQSTARPALEPISADTARPSLDAGSAEKEGVSFESPRFDTSKLSKVVSPTERERKKHRQEVHSPPPVISLEDQPPLDFTEDGEIQEDPSAVPQDSTECPAEVTAATTA